MWAYVIQFIIAIVLAILSKPKFDEKKAPTADDIKLSTNDEVRPIPYIAGTVLLEGSNIVWAANYHAQKITKRVGNWISSSKVTVGYKTFYSLNHSLCWGNNVELIRILIDDKEAYFDLSGSEAGRYLINKPYLLTDGRAEAAEGCVGYFDFYSGSETQTSNEYMQTISKTDFPDYKELSYIVFNDFYWCNSTILPKTDFEVRRLPNKLKTDTEDYSNINNSANAAEILYELLTDTEKFGMNVDPSLIDIDNFRSVAKQLYDEQFGINIIFNSSYSFNDIKQDIEKHIAGNLFVDLWTGLWKIKLVRNDYDKNNLKLFNRDNIKSITDFNIPEVYSLFSEYKVIYKDKYSKYKNKTATAKNGALVLLKNDNSPTTTEYFAITDAVTAQRVAERDLVVSSNILINFVMQVNRDGVGLNLGDAIKITHEEFGFYEEIFRVREIDTGKFEDNTMTLSVIQDYFKFGDPIAEPPDNTKWEPVIDGPIDSLYERVESPNYYAKNSVNSNMFFLTKFNSLAIDFFCDYKVLNKYNNFVNAKTKVQTNRSSSYTPFSLLFSAIDKNETNIRIKKSLVGYDLSLSSVNYESDNDRFNFGANMAYIRDGSNVEFINFREIYYDEENDEYYLTDVHRGLLDTTPKDFNFDAKVYFFESGSLIENIDTPVYLSKIDIIGITAQGADLVYTDETYSDNSRYLKPLLPANLKINGQYFITTMALTDQLNLSWNHRDSKNITTIIKYKDETNYYEQNVIYELKIYDNSTNTLLKSIETTDVFFNFDDELTINPTGNYYLSLRFTIESKRDSIYSHEKYDLVINRE